MSDRVSEFCDGIHEQLESLQSRMDVLKANTGSSWNSLQRRLIEVRKKNEANHLESAEARVRLERWAHNRTSEAKDTINCWIANRETKLLASRAQAAEECAETALLLAQASIDDTERMILEAIAARLDADAVSDH